MKTLLDNKIQSHRHQPMEQLIDDLKNLNDNDFTVIFEQAKSMKDGGIEEVTKKSSAIIGKK